MNPIGNKGTVFPWMESARSDKGLGDSNMQEMQKGYGKSGDTGRVL